MRKTPSIFTIIIIFIAFGCPGISFSKMINNLDSIIIKAENGDAYFQGVLGEIYRRGEFGSSDFEKALKWSKSSADQGNPMGLFNLGELYESGKIGLKDSMKINNLFTRSYKPMLKLAEKGDFRAQCNVANMLYAGSGVEKDPHGSLKWYEKAADEGYSRAQMVLGYQCCFGDSSEIDFVKAKNLFLEAAVQNNHFAQYFLGYMNEYGKGISVDYVKAIEWYKKAAEKGLPYSYQQLGNLYFNGKGVSENYDEAVKWFTKAEKIQNHVEFLPTDSTSYIYNGKTVEGDQVILGLLPPTFWFDIKGGNCGESCLWSLINSSGFKITQPEINHDGTLQGRDLHGNELTPPLDKYGFEYVDKMSCPYLIAVISFFNPMNLFDHTEKYRDFIDNTLIKKIKQGHPIILGVKIYPTKHFTHYADHFILLTGYNEITNEIIFNDHSVRKRIKVEKLLDKTDGYSLVNVYDFLNYIEITNFGVVK
ncbi:MAG: C39 family peptidase [Candidatus Delongbacteria bacterium]|jgi:TPR repeat protein|nr:C39 family peptidase [Candidatus Delongbacteria bacterium]